MRKLGYSFSISAATALMPTSREPAGVPCSASTALQLLHSQLPMQSFWLMEMMPAVGFFLIHSSAFFKSSARISGLVQQSWAFWVLRFPFTRLYHSGWVAKYFAGGRRE